MPLTAEAEMKHLGETKAIADHDHDLVHELSKRLDSIWRYDQYLANAEGKEELRSFWEGCKKQDLQNVENLKRLISKEIDGNCF